MSMSMSQLFLHFCFYECIKIIQYKCVVWQTNTYHFNAVGTYHTEILSPDYREVYGQMIVHVLYGTLVPTVERSQNKQIPVHKYINQSQIHKNIKSSQNRHETSQIYVFMFMLHKMYRPPLDKHKNINLKLRKSLFRSSKFAPL